MQFKVIALDLDGTIAMNDKVDSSTWKVLREAKKAGFIILLVTGRRLNDISKIGPFEDLCQAIVAEDGAAIFFPSTNSVILPFGHLAPEVISKLYALKIPIERGMAIASTWTPHDKAVIEALSATGYAATLEYNKGAVMVMPPGATKGTGLLIALRELGYSPHNVIAFGDAENDRSLFEQVELAVAVANAAPGIKDLADIQLSQSNGLGVRTFVTELMKGVIPTKFRTRASREINLGQFSEGEEISISPLQLTTGNLGIFGASGSGKSWLGGLVAEKLLKLEYQICIIDPEGDYRSMKAFPNTLLLGGKDSPPPHTPEICTLLEYSNISLVLDLSLYEHQKKNNYVTDLLNALTNLHEHRGKPHWFLIDEIHYFCQDKDAPLSKMLASRMKDGGFALVSYKPSGVPPNLLNQIDNLMLTRFDEPKEMINIQSFIKEKGYSCLQDNQLQSMTDRQAFILLQDNHAKCGDRQGVLDFDKTRRKVPHIRHLHKYLRAPLPLEKQFHFDPSKMTGSPLSASSIYDFMRIIPEVPIEALQYHLRRGDFEAWMHDTLHDEELARRVRKIANRNLANGQIRSALVDAVSSRYRELEKLI